MTQKLSISCRLLSLLFLTGLFFSCQDSPKPKATTNKQEGSDSLSLKVALLPTLDALPFFYAADYGIYKAMGVSIKWLVYNSQMDCEAALRDNRADVALSDLVRATMLQRDSRKDVSILLTTTGQWWLVASSGVRMKKLSQLKDRTIAVARFSVTDYLSDLYARQGGLQPNEIYRPQINNVFLRSQMLDEKQVETAVLPEPQATEAVARGHRKIADTGHFSDGMGCLITWSKTLKNKKKRKQVEQLLEGYEKAAPLLDKNAQGRRDSVLMKHCFPDGQVVKLRLKWPRFSPMHLPEPDKMEQAVALLQSRKVTDVRLPKVEDLAKK